MKGNAAIAQFFGDKYGDVVRVVQVGGCRDGLDGVSMEFCGGTHIANTKNIGLFKIKSEGAIASGVRRIEAMTGDAALEMIRQHVVAKSLEIAKAVEKIKEVNYELADMGLEQVPVPTIEGKPGRAGQAAAKADALLNEWLSDAPSSLIQVAEGAGELLQELLNGLKKRQYAGAAFLLCVDSSSLLLGAYCGKDAIADGLSAGDMIREVAALAGGKGGGRADQARGSAPQDADPQALAAAARNIING